MQGKYILSIFMFTMLFGSKVGAQGETTQSLPMVIIIDQDGQENPAKSPGALTIELFWSIVSSKFPILVAKSVLYDLLYRKEDGSFTFDFELSDGKSGWKIYDVNKGLFFLLVPSQFLAEHKNNNGLNIDGNGKSQEPTLQDVTEMFKKGGSLSALKDMSETQGYFKVEDLKSVFQKRISPSKEIPWLKALESQKSWNIILSGHGAMSERVADLNPDILKDFLSFLNTQINTALLLVMSCYAGGVNRIHFKEIAGEQLGSSLGYIVIVQGVTDQLTFAAESFVFFDAIFGTAQLIDKGANLNKVLKQINTSLSSVKLLHKTPHIPQVLLPGGLEFQTFNIDKNVLSLGYVLVEKHRLENKPILVKSKEAVLVYPPVISPALKVGKSPLAQRSEFKKVATGFELLKIVGEPHKEEIEHYSEYFPAYAAYKKKEIIADLDSSIVYPAFISMEPIEELKQHNFKQIELMKEGISGVAQGVMQFLRDAFSIEEMETGQQFYIDKLIGPNDLSLVMELSRAATKNYDEPHKLEKLLNQSIGKEITLEKVTARGAIIRFFNEAKGFSFSFIISVKDESSKENKSAWIAASLGDGGEPFWDFSETSLKRHESFYESSVKEVAERRPAPTVEQKTLPEILKQKQERGPLKFGEAKTKVPSKQMPKTEFSQLLKGPRNQKWAGKVSGSKHCYQKNRSSLLNVRCQNSRNSYWFKKTSKVSAGAFDEKIV